MATELFVDTSAWYAIAVARSVDHASVTGAFRERLRLGDRLVTTNFVMAETHALVLRRVSADAALRVVRTVRQPSTLIVTVTPELEDDAIDRWLARFEDQGFSYTDAVSFAVMRDRGIAAALAVDHHFSVAGFRVLPG